MYQLFIEKQVQKDLEKIPPPDYIKVKNAILNLCLDPRPSGYKKLKARPGYRIRKGNYRIIYDIDDNILNVFILAAGHRKDIYL
jgi:mRNA interferase RelE/StbE